jgi:GNAT superfamily N-acetyltransferase
MNRPSTVSSGNTFTLRVRLAQPEDVSALSHLIETSVRGLVSRDYTPKQIESSIRYLYGVDSLLIADQTYFIVETQGEVVGCGGWSRRRTPFGGDQACEMLDQSLRDPALDAAVIRAFFVHPSWAGRGIGKLLLQTCEAAAASEGFTRFELTATLTGRPFYAAHGYQCAGRIDHVLSDGTTVVFERMTKQQERPA